MKFGMILLSKGGRSDIEFRYALFRYEARQGKWEAPAFLRRSQTVIALALARISESGPYFRYALLRRRVQLPRNNQQQRWPSRLIPCIKETQKLLFRLVLVSLGSDCYPNLINNVYVTFLKHRWPEPPFRWKNRVKVSVILFLIWSELISIGSLTAAYAIGTSDFDVQMSDIKI